jgi:hypothetical protein
MRKPSCVCGECRICKNRVRVAKYYKEHKEKVIKRNNKNRDEIRKGIRECEMRGTEELDRKAMEWLEFWGFRK